MEKSLIGEELLDEGFLILNRVIPSLEPGLAKKYDKQKNVLYAKYQNPVLQLAVIGNYSCGKSTFLNAVLKRELLSMDNLPTTAIPTYIRWDKDGEGEPEITAEDIEGRSFKLWGTEKGCFERKTGIALPKETGKTIDRLTTDSSLIGKVKRIELSFPKEKRYENFCIIDTPGVNPGQEDARKHILETQSILRKEADAAIVLFPAMQVYTADFEDFLLNNAAHLMDDSIFIITKMDMVRRESEREKLLNYVKRLLQQNFKLYDPEVYGISAGNALDYYIDQAGYFENKQWAASFEEVMNKVFQRLRNRRQEIISNRVGETIQELIHIVGEEVRNDIKRLEEDRAKLVKYSLASLEQSYGLLLKKYRMDMIQQKTKWCKSAGDIVKKRINEAEADINYNIDRQTRARGLKEYTDFGLEKDIIKMNNKISQDINKNISKKIRKRGYEFITDVKTCLEEYQYYVGNAGAFFDKQKDKQKYPAPAPVPANLPVEPPGQLSALVDTVLENIELGSLLSILLVPLLAAGFIWEQQMLPRKKLEIKQKVLLELSVCSTRLVTEYTSHVDIQIRKNISWAESLLEAYQKEYKLFFEKKKQEFQKKEEALMGKIKRNRNNLEDMQLAESLMQREKG